jgi:signal transduction histidine kinase
VRERESTRIAREIHDELGQILTALKMDLSWLNKRLTNGQKALREKTKSMSKLTDMIIRAVQRISTELRPGILDDLGLIPAIEWQAQEFQDRTDIKCEITIDNGEIDLDQDRSTSLFRIFQEALTNVARHANATKIKVSLKERPDKLLLKIEDNGRGITEEQISDPKSFGLIGIRERIYPWGGEVNIKGIWNEGTTVTVILPTT